MQINVMNPARSLCVVALALALLGGCAQPVAPQPAAAPVAADDYRRTFEAAVASLRAHGFLIDRQDYRFGRITTKPRIAPQWIEVWNPDNSTFDQTLASSFNDQHRIATVKLDPAAPAADNTAPAAPYQLTIEVAIERATNPNRRLTGSTDGYSIDQQLTATPAQFQRDGITGRSFVPVGTDPQFEQKLLADIQARLAALTEPAKSE